MENVLKRKIVLEMYKPKLLTLKPNSTVYEYQPSYNLSYKLVYS